MKTVKVDIAERSYQIVIDQHLLMNVGEQVQAFLKKGNKVALLVSKTVKKLYSERVVRSLITSGYEVDAKDVEDMDVGFINWVATCIGDINGTAQ